MTPSTDIDPTDAPEPLRPRRLKTIHAAGLLVAASTLMLAVALAEAKPTPLEKCRAAKNRAAGKYAACLQTATATLVTSADGNKYGIAREKCRTTFAKGFATAEAKAAKAGGDCTTPPFTVDDFDESVDRQSLVIGNALAGQGLERCGDGTRTGTESCDGGDLGGATCATQGFALGTLRCASGCFLDTSGCFATRYEDNGDGTVTDHQTGLQWEQKTNLDGAANLADPHDADNAYTWSAGGGGGTLPDGTVFTDFLGKLNNGTSDNRSTTTGCLAGHCDWRLPGVLELEGIEDFTLCQGGGACLPAVFGSVNLGLFYCSATTTGSPGGGVVWVESFTGASGSSAKTNGFGVLAVRGGS